MNTKNIFVQLQLFDDSPFINEQITTQQLTENHYVINTDIEKEEQTTPQFFARLVISGKLSDFLQKVVEYGAKIEIIAPSDA